MEKKNKEKKLIFLFQIKLGCYARVRIWSEPIIKERQVVEDKP